MRLLLLPFIFAIILFDLGSTAYNSDSYSNVGHTPRCRCLPSDPCWPEPSEWASFNSSVSGALIAVRPAASPCHDPTFDEATCGDAKKNFNSSSWRSSFPGVYQLLNSESSALLRQTCYVTTPRSSPCGQGNIPVYAVAVTSPAQIQKTVDFARTKNLRLVIKNTGHDFLSRSAGRGSLEIWTHNIKGIVFSEAFLPEKCEWSKGEEAVTIGAGVQLKELYGAAAAKGKALVIGYANTVGAAGGYIQGGGHSPLGPWKGMASDNALQFTVVTADGQQVTANACQNTDLFWALRGGGGGTFGVVTSVTLRTFPDAPMVTANITITVPDTTNFWSLMIDFHHLIPTIDDANGSGYYFISAPNIFVLTAFFAGESNITFVDTLFQPFIDKARTFNATISKATLPPVNAVIALNMSLSGSDRTGYQILLGSRLISRKFMQSADGPGRVVQAIRELEPTQTSPVAGALVAGGQVARNKDIDSAIHPSWRKALVHLFFVRGWDASTSFEEQAAITKKLTDVEVPILAALEPDMGAYVNEADPNEKNWQQVFWGENYERLLRVKAKWDHTELFMCKPCVGSENWDAESICRLK